MRRSKLRAVRLIDRATEAELAVREMLLDAGVDHRFQEPYHDHTQCRIVDFVIGDVGFEIDGGYHNQPSQKKLDAKRTKWLLAKTHICKIIRFTNDEVFDNPPMVLEIMKSYVGYKAPKKARLAKKKKKKYDPKKAKKRRQKKRANKVEEVWQNMITARDAGDTNGYNYWKKKLDRM